jgi:hypothetical protein
MVIDKQHSVLWTYSWAQRTTIHKNRRAAGSILTAPALAQRTAKNAAAGPGDDSGPDVVPGYCDA